MQSLLIDFETTGLDTSTERIIEIGAQVVDENWNVLSQLSCLVKGEGFPVLTAEITDVTGITQDDLDKRGLPLEDAWDMLGEMVTPETGYAIAYNRQFDESIFRAELQRTGFGLNGGLNWLSQIPWICAMTDIETNYMYKSWKLSHMALEYGVTVNPNLLHRAVNDVDLMRQLLIAAKTTPEAMYNFQQIPWVYVAAKIPAPWTDGGKGKAQATKLGYTWESAKGDDKVWEKCWVKRIKSHQLEAETKHAPFKVVELRG